MSQPEDFNIFDDNEFNSGMPEGGLRNNFSNELFENTSIYTDRQRLFDEINILDLFDSTDINTSPLIDLDESYENENLFNYTSNLNDRSYPLYSSETRKLGRKKKNDTSMSSHTRKSKDNGSKRFMTKCMELINDCFNSEIQRIGLNSKGFKLYKPSIIKFLPLKAYQKPNYFRKTIEYYYENYALPKNAKNKDMYIIHNKNLIFAVKAINDNKLNIMLNTSFEDYFVAFLNDDKIINHRYIILNNSFKTLKDCFNNINDEYNYYTEEEKACIKDYCMRLINGEIKTKNRKY